MASPRTTRLLFSTQKYTCSRCTSRATASGLRWSSTASTEPPSLLTKIKADLKAAMRAKDTARLSVLRGTISEINQAASSSTPITNDLQILSLLKKRRSATQTAIDEAKAANREDLAAKNETEITIIDEYTASVKMMDVAEMRQIVRTEVIALKAAEGDSVKPGVVMKHLLKEDGGPLSGKTLDRKILSELVREELASNHAAS
ncbi:hypothetical protein B0A52_01691 [Exophiala mesophila]|uniref:Altered inheritance of mitochondria protein 41 n=1 Tax=Exophiala mesophila TaxID=212818 RepID=A0A438NFR8_EXOME|nr:hypothetical protein B0A52_01691 [Exophiala mesophila]